MIFTICDRPVRSLRELAIPAETRKLVLLNTGLTSLDGFPSFVTEADLSHNCLSTLAGLPEDSCLVSLDVSYNRLTDLVHVPDSVENLRASRNRITSLEALTKHPRLKRFGISCNHLRTMKGCPSTVVSIVCTNNFLDSWEGFPPRMEKLYASYNHIRTMKGAPSVLNFDCSCNLIEMLDGCPEGAIEFNCCNNRLRRLDGYPMTAQIIRCSGNLLEALPTTWSPQVVLVEATKNPMSPEACADATRAASHICELYTDHAQFCRPYPVPT